MHGLSTHHELRRQEQVEFNIQFGVSNISILLQIKDELDNDQMNVLPSMLCIVKDRD
jgi:hypothetical protein